MCAPIKAWRYLFNSMNYLYFQVFLIIGIDRYKCIWGNIHVYNFFHAKIKVTTYSGEESGVSVISSLVGTGKNIKLRLKTGSGSTSIYYVLIS